jgi:hypothetical protein
MAWYPFDGDLNDHGGYAYHATAGNGASASCGFLQLASAQSQYASLPLGEWVVAVGIPLWWLADGWGVAGGVVTGGALTDYSISLWAYLYSFDAGSR